MDELLAIDLADERHLFYEEMRRLFYAMREIEAEDVNDHSLNQFIVAANQLSNAINTNKLRRWKREKLIKRLKL